MVSCGLFFFFQAEDGIRDPLVTGVQTCALPILGSSSGHSRLGYLRPGRGDSIPVEGLADLAQPCTGRLVAERSLEAGLVEAARLEPERTGGRVLRAEIGAEHR